MRLSVLAILASCGSKDAPVPSGPPPEEPLGTIYRYISAIEEGKRITGPGLAIEAKPLPTAVPGPAYLQLKDNAVIKLDQGKATRVALEGVRNITAIAADGDDLYIADGAQLLRKRGDAVDTLAKAEEMLHGLVVSPDHTVWARSTSAIYRLDHPRWTKVHVGDAYVSDLGFDGAGRLYFSSAEGLFVIDGTLKPLIDFRAVSKEQRERAPCLSVPAINSRGELWIGACGYVIRVTKGKAKFHELASGGTVGGRFVGDKFYGRSWIKPGLLRVALDGKVEAHEESAFAPETIDGRGRLWSTSGTKGIEVRTLGSKPVTLPIGSIPEINSDVLEIVVVGSGPDELPAVTGELFRGTIAGKVMRAGTAIADANVELCSQPAQELDAKRTPCTGAPERVTGKTDSTGRFAIEGVLRSYRVVVEVEHQWFALPIWEKGCVNLTPGAVCDMGVLAVDPFKR